MSNVWQELHSNYQKQDWVDKPSIFAETAIQYFPKPGKVLELGAGHGQDSLFFAKEGYDVVTTDIETSSLQLDHEKIEVRQVDLNEGLPFSDASFEVVYAHMSLHYFDHQTTCKIIDEIKRVLKPGGVLAFLTNSINDPEYKKGELLEEDFFQINKVTKRFFSADSAQQFTKGFEVSLIDNLGQTYKDRAKGIHHLIRFIGRKPLNS